MAGEPAPLAAVQAAVLKSAASKNAQSGGMPQAGASPNTAIAQDLAVMADQAKGYAAGVDQGVVVAQDNRAAAARRLAEERAAADAARQRELAMEQMQTQQARLQGEAAAQADRFQMERESAQQALRRSQEAEAEAEAGDEPDFEAAGAVYRHAQANAPTPIQVAMRKFVNNSTTPTEALKMLDNARRNGDPITEDVDRSMFFDYAKQWFNALHGRAVNFKSLEPKRKPTSRPAAAPAREPERSTDSRGPLVSATTEGASFRVPGTDYRIKSPSWLWG